MGGRRGEETDQQEQKGVWGRDRRDHKAPPGSVWGPWAFAEACVGRRLASAIGGRPTQALPPVSRWKSRGGLRGLGSGEVAQGGLWTDDRGRIPSQSGDEKVDVETSSMDGGRRTVGLAWGCAHSQVRGVRRAPGVPTAGGAGDTAGIVLVHGRCRPWGDGCDQPPLTSRPRSIRLIPESGAPRGRIPAEGTS